MCVSCLFAVPPDSTTRSLPIYPLLEFHPSLSLLWTGNLRPHTRMVAKGIPWTTTLYILLIARQSQIPKLLPFLLRYELSSSQINFERESKYLVHARSSNSSLSPFSHQIKWTPFSPYLSLNKEQYPRKLPPYRVHYHTLADKAFIPSIRRKLNFLWNMLKKQGASLRSLSLLHSGRLHTRMTLIN